MQHHPEIFCIKVAFEGLFSRVWFDLLDRDYGKDTYPDG
jgi:hypothetical protein